jgi:hypothetical protein
MRRLAVCGATKPFVKRTLKEKEPKFPLFENSFCDRPRNEPRSKSQTLRVEALSGYESSREAPMAAFRKIWRAEIAQDRVVAAAFAKS